MKRLVTAALVVFALFFASAAFAQTGMARGKVYDEQGQPLAGAKVVWEFQGGMTRKGEVTTNKKGEFVQVGLPPGLYKFTVNVEGFRSQYGEIRVNLGDPTAVPDFKMARAAAAEGGGDPGLSELKSGVDQAIALAQSGKPDEALAVYADLAAKNPNVHQIPYNMGLLYAGKKDWANAEASYKKALEIKPDYTDALAQLSTVYVNTGRAAEANQLLASSSAGSDPKLLLQQGVVLFNTGKQAEAAEIFQKLVAADPTSAEPYYYLGTIAVGQGKTAECITHLEKYLSLNPQNAQNVATAKGLIAALKK